jgi:nicotinamide mononucleotide transporter
MSPAWEWSANAANTAAIIFAARNSIHTWWLSIAGCSLFGYVFWRTQLYADVTLQLFFVTVSILGWRAWARGEGGGELPIRRLPPRTTLRILAAALAGAAAYGWVLARFTAAYAPYLDSAILAFSVAGQVLLMRRIYESWWSWCVVNAVAIPVYASRGLWLTAGLYCAYQVMAIVALVRWRRLAFPARPPAPAPSPD